MIPKRLYSVQVAAAQLSATTAAADSTYSCVRVLASVSNQLRAEGPITAKCLLISL